MSYNDASERNRRTYQCEQPRLVRFSSKAAVEFSIAGSRSQKIADCHKDRNRPKVDIGLTFNFLRKIGFMT